MKTKIKKGKIIQNCLKVTAATVVASGVGFQFYEIQELNKEVKSLKENHKQTVLELKTANENNKVLEEQKKQIAANTEQLSIELEEIKNENEAINEGKHQSQEENQKLQAENADLAKHLREAKESARPVMPEKTSSDKSDPPTAKDTSVSKTIMGIGTAYTLNEPGVTGITASGKTIQPGMIAMDRSVPMGTRVRITCDSYPYINGIYTVEDRGGAIKGNIVDIYMTDADRMNDFGRRDIKIEFLN